MNDVISEIELFPLELNYQNFVKSLSVYQYEVHMEPEDAKFFGGLPDVTYNISRKLDGIYHSTPGPTFISTKQLPESDLNFRFPSGIQAALIPISRQPSLDPTQDHDLIMKILRKDLRRSIEKSGYIVRGYSAFDNSQELVKGIKASNQQLQYLIDLIGIYAGFYFKIRYIDNQFYLQISPKSIIEFKGDIYGLINHGAYSIPFIEDFCEHVKLWNGQVVDLRRIDTMTCNQPIIDEEPYNGMTFLDYVNSIDDYSGLHSDARLLVILQRRKNALTYATSEGTKPLIDFSHLAYLDSPAYSFITKKMKHQSAERHKLATQYSKKIQLNFNGIDVKLGAHRRYFGRELVSTFNNPLYTNRGYLFAEPFVTLFDKKGNLRHVSEATGDKGAPQDLLTGRYMPFSQITRMKLLMLAAKGYEDAARQLKEALTNYDAPNHIGQILRNIGCRFDISEIQTVDPQSNQSFSTSEFDCAVIVGPKENLGVAGTYVQTELSLLENGIPAQYIIHAPHTSLYFDKSIGKKIRESYSFLTLVLSILAKIGANSIVISSESTKYFPENSVILSYNFARVFEPLGHQSSQHASLESMKASLPLAAAVSVIDQAGSEIIHQYPHIITDETALFRGSSGKLIFDRVPDTADVIVIHKDGMFTSSELTDIGQLRRQGTRVQPVSIVTSAIPRIITSDESKKYLPKAGEVIPISNSEFLLSTTQLTLDYDPSSRGWPNPLSIKIHDLESQEPTTAELKWKILYQIWCLTRAHPATIIPTRRPISIHYSNKMARFLRKSRRVQPEYFRKFADKKNRFDLYSRPFM